MPALTDCPRPVPADILQEWEQIESPPAVARILEKIRATTRKAVYQCAEDYELAYPGYPGDSAFYLEKGKTGRVLYLGVGTGRIFGPMAEANPDAVGLENSPEMLDVFRSRYPDVADQQFLLADATQAPLGDQQFDTVLAPYSFLQVVEERDLPKLLRNVWRWLKPGGHFYADTFSPYQIPFRRSGLEASVRQINAQTRIAIYIVYDHMKQNMTELAHIDRDGDENVLEMPLHYYFPHELSQAFRRAGFAEHDIAGGYGDEPFDPQTNDVLLYSAVKTPLSRDQAPAFRASARALEAVPTSAS